MSPASKMRARCSRRWGFALLFVVVALTLTGLLTHYGDDAKALLLGTSNPVHHVHIVTDEEGHAIIRASAAIPAVFPEVAPRSQASLGEEPTLVALHSDRRRSLRRAG